MAASTELNIILRDAAKRPLLRMTAEIASQDEVECGPVGVMESVHQAMNAVMGPPTG
jgi:hypothetical protein